MTDDRTHDLAASSGAYVLHSMEPEQAAAFEQRLAASENLRIEVAELADTAVELGLTAPPVAPRPELRAALLAAIETTPQLPAETGAAAPAAERLAPVSDIRDARSRRRLLRPIAIAVSAAAAAAIVGGVVVGVVLPSTPAGRIAAVHSASDARSRTVPVEGGGTVEVAWSSRLGAAMATAHDLPALADGKVYELWYVQGTTARAAGTFDGDGTAMLDGRLVDGETIAMTVEPRGGSARPSGTPIAAVAT